MPLTLADFWDLSLAPGDLAARLGFALLFGALIGWERQHRNKQADIRTLILVAVGAAMFVIATEEVIASTPNGLANRLSILGSVIAGVIGGVGFLGAGAIMHHEARVEGVTTAAAIWTTAGIGVTCGLGEMALSALVGGTVLLTLLAARLNDRRGVRKA